MWKLSTRTEPQEKQTSYIGGKPSLPVGTTIPVCTLCGEAETFFFQVAFPSGADWSGKTVACFACTKCADESFLIPEMLSNHLQGADIPAGFLTSYQRNFAFLVFQTEDARIVDSYDERVAFKAIEVTPDSTTGDFGKIGGAPDWLLEDEAPATYDGSIPMVFLLQVAPGFRFNIVDGAPPQTVLDLFGNPSPSPLNYYQLFLGNALYLFGTSAGTPLVYAITQV